MGTTAVFGAGPGLGLGVARHFARKGDRVALVGRNQEKVDGLTAELTGEGLTVAGYVGDVASAAGFDEVVEKIVADLGPLDLAVYQTTAPPLTASSPLEVTVENERPFIEQTLLGPIHAAHALLNPMLERGSGAVLFVMGSSALAPIPRMPQTGIAQSGLRHHLLGLTKATASSGVRLGLLVIGGLILGSDLQRQWLPDAGPGSPGALEPEKLAALLEEMITSEEPERVVSAAG